MLHLLSMYKTRVEVNSYIMCVQWGDGKLIVQENIL